MPTVFKNLPIPPRSLRHTLITVPLAALREIGDMTLIPTGEDPRIRRATIYSAAKRMGIAVRVSNVVPEQVPTPKEPSFAVWRTL